VHFKQTSFRALCLLVLTCAFLSLSAQVPSFTAPDTVCVNGPVVITNTSVGGTTFFWSFCDADLTQVPQAVNMGDISNILSEPVYMDIVSQNGNYYALLTDHYPGNLLRLDFGNSMLNTPTATNLGNFGGIINAGYGTEGIQVIQNNGNWYALIVGGDPISMSVPKIVQVNFGPDIRNPSPVATDWGNLGGLKQPVGFYVFSDGGNWYGFTVNATNNTFTRFDFGNNLDVPPVAVNLGNPGGFFDYPCGICPIKDPATGNWHVFIGNGNTYSPNALERLDFGPSLLNNSPTPVNLGNPGNAIGFARDIKIIQECNQIIGFIPDGTNNDILRLDFQNNILGVPTVTSLGNIGNFDFCHSLSKLFRVGADLYTLVPSVDNNTITRIRFAGCASSTIPNSTQQNPPAVSYSQPGTYNINLIMDDGLSTQSSYCKTVTVGTINPFTLGNDTALCQGDSVVLSYTADPTASYLWQNGSTANSDTVRTTGEYKLTVNNVYGCTLSDSIQVNVTTLPTVRTIPDTAICQGSPLVLATTAQNADSVNWTPQSGLSNPYTYSPVATLSAGATFIVKVYHLNCPAADTVTVGVIPSPVVTITSDTLVCADSILQLSASGGVGYQWSPAQGLSDPSAADPLATPAATGYYYVTVTGPNSCTTYDSVLVTTKMPSTFSLSPASAGICVGDSVRLSIQETNGAPADGWLWISAIGPQDPSGPSVVVSPGQTATYLAVGYDRVCNRSDTLKAVVTVHPNPTVTVSKTNDIGCVLGTATLNATGGVRYSWSPAGSLSDSTISDPVASTGTSTRYYVLVTDDNGCQTVDSVLVSVTKAGENVGFPVPNAFTPNGDGVNDCFGIKYWGYAGEFELSVYNRSGARVFYTRNPQDCWDGTFNGKPQPAGTYVYMIKATALCGEAFKKGTLELIR
jgi:gliding motility-associated-like protein